MHPCIQHAKGAGSMAGLQQTGTFAESILLRFLRLADCLLRVFSLRFQVIQLVAQQFLTTDSRNVGNEMWQGSFVAGGTLVHRPVPDSIPEPAFAGSMLRLQFVVSVLGPQIRPESGFASLGTSCAGMTAFMVVVAQTKIGFLTRGRGQKFRKLPKEERHTQEEEAYARATIALTRARKMCVIFCPLDMKGLIGAATVMYGAGHCWHGTINMHLRGSSLEDCPGDDQFLSLLDLTDVQGGYWNWSAILEMFCEADCGVGILCNGLLQALILVFGCRAWVWYFLAILLSAKQSGSCCWRPGLFELSHGTLARIWGFWILLSLIHSSRLYFLWLELRLSFCMAPLFQSSADSCYSWWPEPFELSLEWCLHYFWWFELFWFFALIRGAQFLATFYFW